MNKDPKIGLITPKERLETARAWGLGLPALAIGMVQVGVMEGRNFMREHGNAVALGAHALTGVATPDNLVYPDFSPVRAEPQPIEAQLEVAA